MFRAIVLLCLAQFIYCDVKNHKETARLVGVNTVHDEDFKINKDTIITRNLKMENRAKGGQEKKAVNPDSGNKETDPDWSYNSIPQDVSAYVQAFKRNMTECLKEVQSTDSRSVKRLSPRTDSPVHGECLIACVLKRNGVIEKGKLNKANLLILVNKFFGKETKLMKKLEKNLDSCIAMSARHTDECDLAAKLNDCTNQLMTHNKRKITVNY